jgi:hypothetical protein
MVAGRPVPSCPHFPATSVHTPAATTAHRWLSKKLWRCEHGEDERWQWPRMTALCGSGVCAVRGRGEGQVAAGKSAPTHQTAQQVGRQEHQMHYRP